MLQKAALCILVLSTATACRSTNAPSVSAPQSIRPEPLAATPPTECLFGANLAELDVSPVFKPSMRGEELAPSRRSGVDVTPKTFSVTDYRHIATGEMYTAFSTFRDEDDGGHTTGWIEQTGGGDVVAEIDDGNIIACKIMGVSPAPLVQSNCLFGNELGELESSTSFRVEAQDDTNRSSRLPGNGGETMPFRRKELTHLGSQQRYVLFHTPETDHINGWIEDSKSGEVVAEIGSSEIYNCSIGANGHTLPMVAADHDTCTFGSDLHDLNTSEHFTLIKEEDLSRLPRFGGEAQRQYLFKAKTFKHTASGNLFLVFNTFRNEDDGGRSFGWIEAEDSSEVVAEIDDSTIYNCQF